MDVHGTKLVRKLFTFAPVPPNRSFERTTGLRPTAAQLMIRKATMFRVNSKST